MKTDVLFSSQTEEWETPQNLFDKLNRVFRFDLDAAASDSNHKVDNYFTKEQNGLLQDWTGHVVWCNPPYGRRIREWVEKASNAVDMVGGGRQHMRGHAPPSADGYEMVPRLYLFKSKSKCALYSWTATFRRE